MVQCVVDGCSSRSDVHDALSKNVHFHRVPKDPEIRKRWLKAIKKKEIKNSTRVCSLHFKKEDYYVTTHGLHKLIDAPAPSRNMEVEPTHDDTSDSSEDEQMPNVQYSEQNINDSSQSQQASPKETEPKIEITDNVLVPSNMKNEDEVQDDAVEECDDEQMLNLRPQKHTDSVSGSSNMKRGVQKYTVKTPLEKKLLKELKKLQVLGKQRMEAINCLMDQNKRLLKRNSYLEKANKYNK